MAINKGFCEADWIIIIWGLNDIAYASFNTSTSLFSKHAMKVGYLRFVTLVIFCLGWLTLIKSTFSANLFSYST